MNNGIICVHSCVGLHDKYAETTGDVKIYSTFLYRIIIVQFLLWTFLVWCSLVCILSLQDVLEVKKYLSIDNSHQFVAYSWSPTPLPLMDISVENAHILYADIHLYTWITLLNIRICWKIRKNLKLIRFRRPLFERNRPLSVLYFKRLNSNN